MKIMLAKFSEGKKDGPEKDAEMYKQKHVPTTVSASADERNAIRRRKFLDFFVDKTFYLSF